MNKQRAAYTAKYCMKDQVVIDITDGRTPQFAGMSLKPALGSGHMKIVGFQIRDVAQHQYDVPTHVRLDGKMRPIGKTCRNALREELDRPKETHPAVLRTAAQKLQAMRQDAKANGTSVGKIIEEKTKGKVFKAEVILERKRNREAF